MERISWWQSQLWWRVLIGVCQQLIWYILRWCTWCCWGQRQSCWCGCSLPILVHITLQQSILKLLLRFEERWRLRPLGRTMRAWTTVSILPTTSKRFLSLSSSYSRQVRWWCSHFASRPFGFLDKLNQECNRSGLKMHKGKTTFYDQYPPEPSLLWTTIKKTFSSQEWATMHLLLWVTQA